MPTCDDDPLWRGHGATNAAVLYGAGSGGDLSNWTCADVSHFPTQHCGPVGNSNIAQRNASGITAHCACLETCGSCNRALFCPGPAATASPTAGPTGHVALRFVGFAMWSQEVDGDRHDTDAEQDANMNAACTCNCRSFPGPAA